MSPGEDIRYKYTELDAVKKVFFNTNQPTYEDYQYVYTKVQQVQQALRPESEPCPLAISSVAVSMASVEGRVGSSWSVVPLQHSHLGIGPLSVKWEDVVVQEELVVQPMKVRLCA